MVDAGQDRPRPHLGEREIKNLPLVSRNPYNFALLQAGVTGYENNEFGVPRFSANGTLLRINYQIDGNTNTAEGPRRPAPDADVGGDDPRGEGRHQRLRAGVRPDDGHGVQRDHAVGHQHLQGVGQLPAPPEALQRLPVLLPGREDGGAAARHEDQHLHGGGGRPDPPRHAPLLRRLREHVPRPVTAADHQHRPDGRPAGRPGAAAALRAVHADGGVHHREARLPAEQRQPGVGPPAAVHEQPARECRGQPHGDRVDQRLPRHDELGGGAGGLDHRQRHAERVPGAVREPAHGVPAEPGLGHGAAGDDHRRGLVRAAVGQPAGLQAGHPAVHRQLLVDQGEPRVQDGVRRAGGLRRAGDDDLVALHLPDGGGVPGGEERDEPEGLHHVLPDDREPELRDDLQALQRLRAGRLAAGREPEDSLRGALRPVPVPAGRRHVTVRVLAEVQHRQEQPRPPPGRRLEPRQGRPHGAAGEHGHHVRPGDARRLHQRAGDQRQPAAGVAQPGAGSFWRAGLPQYAEQPAAGVRAAGPEHLHHRSGLPERLHVPEQPAARAGARPVVLGLGGPGVRQGVPPAGGHQHQRDQPHRHAGRRAPHLLGGDQREHPHGPAVRPDQRGGVDRRVDLQGRDDPVRAARRRAAVRRQLLVRKGNRQRAGQRHALVPRRRRAVRPDEPRPRQGAEPARHPTQLRRERRGQPVGEHEQRVSPGPAQRQPARADAAVQQRPCRSTSRATAT